MVDPIGPRPVKPSDAVARVTRAAPTRPSTGNVPREVESSSARIIARDMAARPPVDATRVDALRRSIAEGSYRIDPAAIADRLLAAKNEWVSDEPA